VLNTNTAVIKYELRGQFSVQTSELMYKETVQTHPYHQIYVWSGRALKITLI